MDRIDLHVTLEAPRADQVLGTGSDRPDTSAMMRQRVEAAREAALKRQGCANGALGARESLALAQGDAQINKFLCRALDRHLVSPRGLCRLLRVSRTLADLEEATTLNLKHLVEAMTFRPASPGHTRVLAA